MTTIAFATAAQLLLWTSELRGQISDGHWENSRPHDHFRPWCDAKVIVDPQNLGRDFYAPKENYNFTSPDLLTNEVVEGRMRYRLALLEQQPDAVARLGREAYHRLPESDQDWEDCADQDWKQKYIAQWTAAGLTKLTGLQPTSRELKKILTEMKAIVKMWRKRN